VCVCVCVCVCVLGGRGKKSCQFLTPKSGWICESMKHSELVAITSLPSYFPGDGGLRQGQAQLGLCQPKID
jgi:hypothetical protein